MTTVHKIAKLPFRAEDMYALVDDIESYPQFLPWCDRVEVEREGEKVTATLFIAWKNFAYSFTTCNRHTPPHQIDIHLKKGPLKKLDAQWVFHTVDAQHCRIDFYLETTFMTSFIEKAIAPIMEIVAEGMVTAFRERAQKIYG